MVCPERVSTGRDVPGPKINHMNTMINHFTTIRPRVLNTFLLTTLFIFVTITYVIMHAQGRI